jgi:phosphoribosylanthranilate isomerase
MIKSDYTSRVKICCIRNEEEAHLAIHYGATALGLVSEMPSGPGVISEEEIARIVAGVPPGIGTFLLTSRQSVPEIIEQHKRCRTNTLQLCDRLTTGTHLDLKKALPGISIVQVIHVTGEESIDEAIKVAENVNGILLDSGNQNLPVKKLGGTGKTHNWQISQKIVQSIGKPVFLAGGLNPENVRAAIQQVRPFAVDICSGVRTEGILDEKKLKNFFNKLSQKL